MTHQTRTAIAVVLVALLASASYWYWSRPSAPPLPVVSRVPEFAFETESRRPFTRSGLEGRVTIADFIFTSCAGTCPMMSTKMASLQEELAGDGGVQFVSFSVDPETDTPEALAAYGKGYGAVPGKWTFLTGPRKEIYALTRDGFHLGLDTEGVDAIIHSQKFVLVDARADIRGYYDSEDEAEMQRLVRDARTLAEEGAGS